MTSNKYKDFIEIHHPELMPELDDYLAKDSESHPKKRRQPVDRGSWEYVCNLLPKLKNFAHIRRNSSDEPGEAMQGSYTWTITRPVRVGNRMASIGISLTVHTNKWGKNLELIKLTPKEHYISFYTMFEYGSTSCVQSMTNIPGRYCRTGTGKVIPVDIASKRKLIYQYLGV